MVVCWAMATSHAARPCRSIIEALQSSPTLVRRLAPSPMSEKLETVEDWLPTTFRLPSTMVPTINKIGAPMNHVNASLRVTGSELVGPIGTAGARSGNIIA